MIFFLLQDEAMLLMRLLNSTYKQSRFRIIEQSKLGDSLEKLASNESSLEIRLNDADFRCFFFLLLETGDSIRDRRGTDGKHD